MRALFALLVSVPFAAHAFCGFYVSGGGAQLFADASMVVLVRDGTRTVLSMQNDYRGPPEDFALVVPVPVVLEKQNVQTLPREAFTRLDELTSPRLVELPTGPCGNAVALSGTAAGLGSLGTMGGGLPRDLGVKVEAKFEVEEYEVVILSAKFSLGLEVWLKENRYRIPSGAEAALRPYVQAGSKFFVAKVNAKKVKLVDGHAVLSPLRFHYDSEAFSLPLRLGLLNSAGTQDLIVHVIAKSRYELANLKNVLVPTNLDVRTRVQPQFGGFYQELLARTFQQHPRAAVTEFAWEGALPPPTQLVGGGLYGVTCDPCPPPHPVDNPLARYLGVDRLPKIKTDEGIAAFAAAATVTRLHLRYTKDSAPDDLVFKAVEPIAGGTPEVKVAGPAPRNRFQGRYVMWVNECGSPGMFSPPPTLSGPSAQATKLVDPFEQLVVTDVPELGVKAVPLSKDAPPLPYVRARPQPQGFLNTAPTLRGAVALPRPEVSAGLDRDVVERVFQQRKGQLQYCYERELLRNPSLQGKVVLQAVIDANGRVSTATLAQSTLGAGEDCMLARLRTFVFPAPKGAASVIVKQPVLCRAEP
ncbi:MAG: DUF2330 domain-containing protein [Myxococcota bacterium]